MSRSESIPPAILLSFDIEECDVPLECGGEISPGQQMAVSKKGLDRILAVLDRHDAVATFYVTAKFAEAHAETIRAMSRRHEIASHGFDHSRFEPADLLKSRMALEAITGLPVLGYRMARMAPVADADIANAGYRYNSSLHPTWIPGRYNHFFKPRTWFRENGLVQLPASVTPLVRMPLFWLSFKNLPLPLLAAASRWTLRHDGYLNVYWHPWEFAEEIADPAFKVPGYMRRHAGQPLADRLDRYLSALETSGRFATTADFVATLPTP